MKDINIAKINITTNELLNQACATDKDKLFLYFIPRDSGETFGQFKEHVNMLSNYMEKVLEIKKGDRVCTMADNSPELLHTIVALNCVGAVWVPLNNQLIGESLKYIIDHSDANQVFVSTAYEERIRIALNQMKPIQVQTIDNAVTKYASMSKIYDNQTRPSEINVIMYTSGTTGFPKGVMHSHISNIRTGVRSLGILETAESERIHVYLPFFHAWAYAILMGALYYKASLYVDKGFNVDTYWSDIDKYNIAQDHWTGTVPVGLMKLPVSDNDKERKIKIFGTFGALYEQMTKRWPRMRFQSLYGQTEHPCATAVPSDQIFQGSDGLPKAPDEILIVNDQGISVRTNEIGEIVIRCKCGVRFSGYYRNSDATSETLKGDDIYTGDLGYLDERGHLHFSGRKKDALRVRGEMVSVEHIEYLITSNPKIRECAVVGYRPPEKETLKEDEIVAHIVLQAGETFSAQEFHNWSQSNLPKFMRPKYVFLKNELPKTITNRIQKFKLREERIEGAEVCF